MRITSSRAVTFAIASLGLAAGCTLDTSVESTSATSSELGVAGGIFTTTADGTRVNANIYPSKDAVYLDGGPGPHAPVGAAALPAGDYYFQVTNPSGRVLLSTDDIECRRVHISTDGVIDAVVGMCTHVTGIDVDHASLGAITVQLMPYDDTPNPGGEYKVWMTPVGAYDPAARVTHGFIPRFSKTDNYKVRGQYVAPPCCGNGIVETGEECDDGNTVDGDGCSSTCQLEPKAPPPEPCCGNGIVETGEQCDDSNTVDGDGCSSTCQIELPCVCPSDWSTL